MCSLRRMRPDRELNQPIAGVYDTKDHRLDINREDTMSKLSKTLGLTALATVLSAGSAYAQDVNMLSINTNNPGERDYFAAIEAAFEAANPGVDVVIEYQDDESFKQRLPTLLQSDARPDLFFSWGGGVFYDQAEAGVLADIGDMMSPECKADHSAAGLGAFNHNGVQHGMPMYAAEVVMWYNRALAAEAGINPEEIETWEQFLTAVETARAAGVTPMVVGGQDKWPVHFIYGLLAMRIVGADGIAAASAGENGGFNTEAFIEVGRQLERLAALEPFQPGYMSAGYGDATGLFGDGAGIFHIMGNWDFGAQAASATDGGLSEDELGIISFPSVDGGAGAADATFGGINGWLVSEGASQNAVDFLCFMLNSENQATAGAEGFWIPVAQGASDGIENPFNAQISANLAGSSYHQLFLDQALGASVGGTVNDVSADLASGATTPEEAAERLEEARMFQ